jgi:predicted metal-dependent hydrolase
MASPVLPPKVQPVYTRPRTYGAEGESGRAVLAARSVVVSCQGMQLRLRFRRDRPPRATPTPTPTVLIVSGKAVPVEFVRHARARHYILRVGDAGALRVTIPRAGTRAGAEQFLRDRRSWIEREHARLALEAPDRGPWQQGSAVLFRGVESELRVSEGDARLTVTFADQAVDVATPAAADLRPAVERHLRRVAVRELPGRLGELALAHGFEVNGVSIRNQRSRWGSCSPRGHISLNWRLIQLPLYVSDYVLLHELVHLRHLNHSVRFWRELDRLCPWHKDARAWLRRSRTLRPGHAG